MSPSQSPISSLVCAAGSTEQNSRGITTGQQAQTQKRKHKDVSPGKQGEDEDEESQPKAPKGSRRDTVKERKYPCLVCDKRFTRPSSLACHRRTHTGEKPHMCMFPGCGKQFSVQSNLRRHTRIHEKSFLPTPLASGSITPRQLDIHTPEPSPMRKPKPKHKPSITSSNSSSKKSKIRQVPSNAPAAVPPLDPCGLQKPFCMPASSVGCLQPMTTAVSIASVGCPTVPPPLPIVPSNAFGNMTPWQSASTLLPLSGGCSSSAAAAPPSTADTLTLDTYQQQEDEACGFPMTAPVHHPGFGVMRSISSANLNISTDHSRSASIKPHAFYSGPASAGILPLQYQAHPFSAQPDVVFALAPPATTPHPPLPSLLLAPCTPTMPLSAAAYSAMYTHAQGSQQQPPAHSIPEPPYSAFGFF
ncbi:hypothetical protein EV178_004329 [Coemansia sp. RSA 1646]|nr:hypothetical protein EV178_004329 [Coemansia sp. RSA 1646]